VPNEPRYEKLGSAGMTTLWVVFVIMLFSTLVFSIMGYRMPVVSFFQQFSIPRFTDTFIAKASIPRPDFLHHTLRYHFLLCYGYR
jgi:hypothetical protein